ncbi:recombinase [Acinetobacter phage Ab69]|nr:recombinase [Acinetobacter phage Ab69]
MFRSKIDKLATKLCLNGVEKYLQLAQRSGQIKELLRAVYDTDTEESVATSFIPQKVSGKVIGYLAYLETVTGFDSFNND